jgi:hypothetical protein
MRKLLITTAAMLAFASAAHAGNSATQTDAAIRDAFAHAQNSSDPNVEKVAKVIYDANGHIDGILGTKGNLLVANSWPKVGEPRAFLRPATPSGQLAACDSAEVVQTLARITNTTLAGIFYPRALGANDGKKLCTAGIRSPVWSTYTVEWLDKAKGTYWVQVQ